MTRDYGKAAREAGPNEQCGACLVVRKFHGPEGHTRHWFVRANTRDYTLVRLPRPDLRFHVVAADLLEAAERAADAANRLCGALHNGEKPSDEDFRALWDWASGVLADGACGCCQ